MMQRLGCSTLKRFGSSSRARGLQILEAPRLRARDFLSEAGKNVREYIYILASSKHLHS